MKKLLLILIAVMAIGTLSSCTKDESYWKVETSSIKYYDYSVAKRFSSEIEALDDGVTWTVSQVERKVDAIVKKYDGELGCTVYFKTGASMSGPWTVKRTWEMKLK